MEWIKRMFGICIIVPFMLVYSFIVGPLLMALLIPGGLLLFVLILGYRDGFLALKHAFISEQKVSAVIFPENVNIPKHSNIEGYRDAFLFRCDSTNAKQVYFAIFAYLPKSVQSLLKLRNRIVKQFGFSATDSHMASTYDEIREGGKAGFLVYQHVANDEVVSFSEEANMAIWLSVKRQEANSFTVATQVLLKTRKGKLYMALIKPFHKIIAPYCIYNALKSGRIK